MTLMTTDRRRPGTGWAAESPRRRPPRCTRPALPLLLGLLLALALALPAASQAVGTGQLTVNIEPQAARATGAQWRVGAGAWQRSGAWVYGLREGDHLVTFKATPGFVTPASRLVGINGYYPTFLDAGYCGGGSAVAWGSDHYGQRTVPDPDSDFVAVAAGGGHSLGLKADGRVVCWGWNAYGQCRVPAPNSETSQPSPPGCTTASASRRTAAWTAGAGTPTVSAPYRPPTATS